MKPEDNIAHTCDVVPSFVTAFFFFKHDVSLTFTEVLFFLNVTESMPFSAPFSLLTMTWVNRGVKQYFKFKILPHSLTSFQSIGRSNLTSSTPRGYSSLQPTTPSIAQLDLLLCLESLSLPFSPALSLLLKHLVLLFFLPLLCVHMLTCTDSTRGPTGGQCTNTQMFP